MEGDVQLLCPRLNAVGTVVAGVVQKDMNGFTLIRVFLANLTQKHDHGLLITVGFGDQGDGAESRGV